MPDGVPHARRCYPLHKSSLPLMACKNARMLTAVIDTVIFDFGGVLSATGRHSDFSRRFPPEVADQVARIFLGDVTADGDHPWHRLERGEITFSEARRHNHAALVAAGIEMPAPPPGGAQMIDFVASQPMLDLVHELRDAGFRLGVLTNNVAEFRERWRAMLAFEELFDDIVDSHEVGLRKPNPAIYQLALARLGAEASRTAFLDDLPANVDAADVVGMHGVLVGEDPTAAIAAVRRLAGFSN